jgi:hypothetical protein
MPTTSNFGWTTPADTDLVKDGAAAIRTLGNGIDTSFLDLKGGTTGQVLAKNSNTDLDFTWSAAGDITEVQAGTGISVASGTGPIPVITNTVATAFDAAGDLVYGTGADTFTKLAIGTAGQFLKVNSGATAPEWTAAPSGAVKQIVFAEYSTATATNTTTLTDIGLSATITPSSTSSRILIMTQASYSVSDSGQTDIGVKAALLRGATIIVDKPTASAGYFNLASNTAGKGLGGVVTLLDYDDPATTSATTYKFQGASYDSTDCTWQPNSGKSTMILIEVLF